MAGKGPIFAKPAERDPLRNFKFAVRFWGDSFTNGFADMGFVQVGGLGVQTEVIPYREGGDNTTTRKLPGQSDFGPLSLIRGVFMHDQSPSYEWMKRIFSTIWGAGNTGFNGEFRCNASIFVLKHPVTRWTPGEEGDPLAEKSAGLRFDVYNCWPGTVQYNDLNAGDNSIMVETITLHHEGWQAFYGANAAASTSAGRVLTGRNNIPGY